MSYQGASDVKKMGERGAIKPRCTGYMKILNIKGKNISVVLNSFLQYCSWKIYGWNELIRFSTYAECFRKIIYIRNLIRSNKLTVK